MPTPDPFRLLVPRPRSITPTGGVVARDALGATPVIQREAGLPRGSYRMSLDASGVTIAAGDEAGARHAEATLAQIHRLPDADLPACRIEDAPALSRRGVMLDVSRCRVPRMDAFAELAPVLESLKLDHLQCYTEHAFAYRAHEPVWADADPITHEECRTLDTLLRRHGIELAANQNCFGHLTRWLRLPAYASLAETHGDWDFAGMPRSGPFSLCPIDPASLPFVEALLDELLPCFESPLVNVGCDETYDVGQGRSRGAVESEGKATVYGRFVGAVCRAVLDRGRTPMFWGDIAKENPDALAMIPGEAHALVWGYEPAHDFEGEARLHASVGRPWWVCPGTSSWRTFTGRSSERHTNIRRAARAGIDHGATGMLITDWGDVGHRQVWPIALLAIAEGADAAWTGRERHEGFLEAVSLQVFNDRSLSIAGWLEELGDADEAIRAVSGVPAPDGSPTRLLNASALFAELHPPPLPLALPADPGPWRTCRDTLEDLAARVPAGAGPLVEQELRHAVRCARWACDVALDRRTGQRNADARVMELEAIKDEQAALWTQRSRLGGLENSLAFWDAIPLTPGQGGAR
jgi:hexosaminidase